MGIRRLIFFVTVYCILCLPRHTRQTAGSSSVTESKLVAPPQNFRIENFAHLYSSKLVQASKSTRTGLYVCFQSLIFIPNFTSQMSFPR